MRKRSKDKFLFKVFRFILRPFYRKPKIINVEVLTKPSIILANHACSKGPATWSYYFPYEFKIWANSYFTTNFKTTYKHLKYDYLITKTKRSKFTASILSIIGAPFIHLMFKVSKVIPVYNDLRFYQTIKQSVETIKDDRFVIIFPEYSEEGYDEHPKVILPGFLILAKELKRQGIDIDIICAYQSVKRKTITFAEPENINELLEEFSSDEEILKHIINRINDLDK